MLDGWYCRSMANAAAAAEEEEQALEESQCKKQYKFLKRKFKNLIYENECFRDALRLSQKRLLLTTRDRNFLLDRLLQYEKLESSSESEDTESSDDQDAVRVELTRKRKLDSSVAQGNGFASGSGGKVMPTNKRKKPNTLARQPKPINQPMIQLPTTSLSNNILSDGHMTPEEVERHLQSRQSYMELMPERAPLTVPTEMFSNEPSLDSESNDIGELETSPSNIGEELSIDMIPE